MRHEEFRTTFTSLVQQEEEQKKREAEFKVRLGIHIPATCPCSRTC
jgi:hypothetical protein